ncbi:MAG: hypothetical protein DDT31_01619 [Syntrophomonadaceae bacterium]|nr:hypothetical protein [Bacillota bacterium]
MRDPSIIGNLKYIYMDSLEVTQRISVSHYLIQTTAKLLQDSGGRNWVPIIVKMKDDDTYEVIGNTLAYAVAEQAGLERVWCIVADDAENTTLLARALSGEAVPPLNLSTASKDEIRLALEYLIEQPGNPLKGIQLATAVSRIFEAPRNTWKDLSPITSLKCCITKGKKLDYLKTIFYVEPSVIVPELVVQPSKRKTTKKTSAEEKPIGEPPENLTVAYLTQLTIPTLKEMASNREITVPSKAKKAEIIQLLLAQA